VRAARTRGRGVMFDQLVRDKDIAIIAMSGRFPGAADVPRFWHNLSNRVESFAHFTDDQLRSTGVPEDLIAHPDYVKVRPVLDQVRGFDAGFFGYSPREAELTDPQQRLFLEVAWEVLEIGGYGRPDNRGRVGLFAGANISTYMYDRFGHRLDTMDEFELAIGNDKDALVTKVAYRLNLTGPVVAVQTFCSTSGSAIHLACQSLRNGEAELALAGGVCVRIPDRVGYLFVDGGMKSPDGHVRTFDARARGGIFGDGAGVVLLKPLRAALADRDCLLAVIRGTAMNNDGAAKFSYTAPSLVGQSTAVAAALRDADVSPRDISYVEAHGTATELGDPIEVAALTKAFRSVERERSGTDLADRQYCAIGSVKTNVGHLDRAATVAGLIKVVEAMRNESIPESLNFQTPNPQIDFVRSPFYVAGKSLAWPRQPGQPRLAGLNSLGIGGTNVHIVVQEAPPPRARVASLRRWQVLPLSAKTENAVEEYRASLAEQLRAGAAQDLGDVAFTLQVGRASFEHRRVCVAESAAGAAAALAGRSAGVLGRTVPSRPRPAAFVVAGVGEHHAGMVGELYRTEPTFQRHLDEGHRLLEQLRSLDVRAPLTAPRAGPAVADLAMLMGRAGTPAPDPLTDTRIAQPAVFLAEYALAGTLMEWGVMPAAVLGYSVGEYVAACIAGVLSLPDALRLVAHRADLIGSLPRGAMLAVGLTWDELIGCEPDLGESGIDLAAVNPGQIVVGGPTESVHDLADRLRARDVVCRGIQTSHAFHTRMLAGVGGELTRWVADNIALQAPRLPYLSNVTGKEVDAELVTDPAYWSRHMCEPVQFTDCLAALLRRGTMAIVEIGPGRSFGAMVRAHPDCDRSRWPLVVSTLPAASERHADDRALADALGQLWLAGVDIDWDTYNRAQPGWTPGRVSLPTYPFQRSDYWPSVDSRGHRGDGATTTSDEPFAEDPDDAAAQASLEVPPLPETQWLNLPVWRQRLRAAAQPDDGATWVMFANDGVGDPLGDALRLRLLAAGKQVVLVRAGDGFMVEPDGYRIRPGDTADMIELFTALKRRGLLPDRVVHMWAMSDSSVADAIRRGTHSLIALARAAHEVGFGPWKLDVITAGVYQASGSDPVRPERSTVLGPCTNIPVECPGASVRVIDLVDGATPPVTDVLDALRSAHGHQRIALRGGRAWVPDYEIVDLPDDRRDGGGATIRSGGVYLITGGLGGIGLALAGRLARDYQAKLVLMGRSDVPDRRHWHAILSDPAAGDQLRRRVTGLRELVEAGVEVEVVRGDVSVRADVERAVSAARERFGELNGVLHAAGLPGTGLMQLKSSADVDRVLAPKVFGTLALADALRDVGVDFVVLFSSVASVTGALGQADYSAANNFLDAFAYGHGLPRTRVVSIGWGEWTWNGWADGLDGYEPVLRDFYERHREQFGISFDQGWRVLQRVLATDEPYVVVSTQDFAGVVEGSRTYAIDDIQGRARRHRGERHVRPALAVPFVPPRTATERMIADIWGEALGVDQVGVDDNFFDLGGSSLLGVGVVAAVRGALELDHLPAHVIYEAPTVASLAAAVDPHPGAQAEATTGGEVDQRAEQRQRRLARRRRAVRVEEADR
jgi:acyl transferase domain-containing protein